MKLTVEQSKLAEAVQRGIISEEQAQKLWSLFGAGDQNQAAEKNEAPMSKFLYYFGALIVIGAMGWFMNNTWEQFGGGGLFLIADVYALGFIGAGRYFLARSASLSGLLIVMAVCMVPLGTFGLQKWLGVWPHGYPGYYKDFHVFVKSGWFTMEVATIIAGLISLKFARIPFATAPIAFVLWYMSMDITPILFGPDYNWHARKIVSLVFGLAVLLIAFLVDRRKEVDYAKWLYIFGAIMFWGGLSSLNGNSELSKFGYCLLNVFMMMVGVLLERRVFTVFGALGVFGYIGYLAWRVFRDSMLFPFALTAIGLALIYLGWLYHRKRDKVEAFAQAITPKWIIASLPRNRGQ